MGGGSSNELSRQKISKVDIRHSIFLLSFTLKFTMHGFMRVALIYIQRSSFLIITMESSNFNNMYECVCNYSILRVICVIYFFSSLATIIECSCFFIKINFQNPRRYFDPNFIVKFADNSLTREETRERLKGQTT